MVVHEDFGRDLYPAPLHIWKAQGNYDNKRVSMDSFFFFPPVKVMVKSVWHMIVKKKKVLRAVINTLDENLLKKKCKNSQEHLYCISSVYLQIQSCSDLLQFVMAVSDRIFLIKDWPLEKKKRNQEQQTKCY